MHVDVVLDPMSGRSVKFPITARTCIGEIVQFAAYKITSRPNLLAASLSYRGAPLPLHLRACALPNGSSLTFHMDLPDLETTHANAIEAAHELTAVTTPSVVLVQLPSTKESRRVQVDRHSPVSTLREAMEIPADLTMHYNKRPILDETRTFDSLRMTDAKLITFALLNDQSFLTSSCSFGQGVTTPLSTSLQVSRPFSGGHQNTTSMHHPSQQQQGFSMLSGGGLTSQRLNASAAVVRPQSAANVLSLDQLSSPTKRKGGLLSPPRSRPITAAMMNPSAYVSQPPSATVVPGAVVTMQSPPRSRILRTQQPQQLQQDPNASMRTPLPASASSSYTGHRFISSANPRDTGGDATSASFYDERTPYHQQQQYLVDPSPIFQPPQPQQPQQAPLPHSSVLVGDTTNNNNSLRHIKIIVSDPEDNGFTHDITVQGDRMVSSLRQFVSEPSKYWIYCDRVLVEKDDVTTFRSATGGHDGAYFTFQLK